MPRRLLLLLLLCPLVWRAAAYPGFLPVGFQDVANMFREVSNLMAKAQSGTGKELGELDNALDYNLLPPNYHTEEEDEHQVGNGTIYSRRKIDKVTDNKTGDMIFSQKTVASIKQNYHSDAELGKKDSQESESQEKEMALSPRSNGVDLPFEDSRPLFRPRLAFLFMHLPVKASRTEQEQVNPSWLAAPRFRGWLPQMMGRLQSDEVSFPELSENMQPLPRHSRRHKYRHHMRQPRIVYLLKKR